MSSDLFLLRQQERLTLLHLGEHVLQENAPTCKRSAADCVQRLRRLPDTFRTRLVQSAASDVDFMRLQTGAVQRNFTTIKRKAENVYQTSLFTQNANYDEIHRVFECATLILGFFQYLWEKSTQLYEYPFLLTSSI